MHEDKLWSQNKRVTETYFAHLRGFTNRGLQSIININCSNFLDNSRATDSRVQVTADEH